MFFLYSPVKCKKDVEIVVIRPYQFTIKQLLGNKNHIKRLQIL